MKFSSSVGAAFLPRDRHQSEHVAPTELCSFVAGSLVVAEVANPGPARMRDAGLVGHENGLFRRGSRYATRLAGQAALDQALWAKAFRRIGG